MTLPQRNTVLARSTNFYYLMCKLDRAQYPVYRDNKYTDKLAHNYDFMPKVVVLDDAQHIIDIVNETTQKYGQYYQQSDAWNHEADNLTYRPGPPPWSIAHAKGQNTLLSDDDILKYHALERL